MLKTVQTGTGGGGGTPGGSTLQVQYNNAGAFAGMSGTSWDDTNRSLTITGATVTTSNPVINASQTWNNAAVNFEGLKLNVTDTSSGGSSALLLIQQSGSDRLNLRKNGILALFGTPQLRLTGDSAEIDFGVSLDLTLIRDAADTLAQRRGTNTQTLRIYNTYTDASNYERLTFNYNTGDSAFQIAAQYAGTGSARPLQFQTGGNNRWQISTSGHFLAYGDNLYDIGGSGANRPKNLYLAGKATIGGGVLPRVTSSTSASSLTPDASANDMYAYTALAANLTINAPTGSPVDGQKLSFRFLDNGTARTLTWNATFTAIGVTLPTTTTISKTLYVGCIYNSNNTRWDVVSIAQEA